ncbi:ankyrin repeat-containing protein [Oleoguttula sp. CCFEE 5521]
MTPRNLPSLTADDIDDLLYYTRVNEKDELLKTIDELAQKYQCSKETILEAGIDPETGNSTLQYCAANGLSDLLPTLLQLLPKPPQQANGGDASGQAVSAPGLINRQNAQGSTPLHWASLNGHLPVVKLLIEAGADMWIKNSAGHLAMFEAERADKGEVVQYLLEAGGKEVESLGHEGQPSSEDVQDIDADTPSDGSAAAGADKDADVTMGEAGPG